MKKVLSFIGALLLSSSAFAQFGVVAPLHVQGKQLNDEYGNKVVLHGVMDTPSPYFNRWRWGYNCNDAAVSGCISYFDKLFTAITKTSSGAYCNIFRLHLEPGWTNDPNKKATNGGGENDISRFSASRLQKYLDALYLPIAQKALNHGLYVVIRPPGVCPQELKVGDYYQDYLKTVWNIVSQNSWLKQHSGVVSLELANEPIHIKNRYGQSSPTAMRDYFQPIVDIIRRNGFKGIIWIPGTGYQSQYQDYATYPVSDNNYGYAVHVYPGWYGASDNSYNHQAFISNFQKQVPVVNTKPILVSEIDWSPERPGAGKYNEFGQWVASNYGTWGTASTSKWGNAWKAVMDHFGNISMNLTSVEDYIDIDAYINSGQVKPAFNGLKEACSGACWEWYKEYAKVNYAHASGSGSGSGSGSQTGGNSGSATTPTGTNLIPVWTDNANYIPNGWIVADNGELVNAGSNITRGPRIMTFAGGDFKSAFYCREIAADKAGYIEYGAIDGHRLSLGFGEYLLTCNIAAWKGSPYVKVEVFNPNNQVLASTIVKAAPNMDGATGSVNGSTKVSLSFYSMDKGNYRVRFSPVADQNGNGGVWEEALVANVSLISLGNPLAFQTANEVPAGWTIYNDGEKVAAGMAGVGPRIFTLSSAGQLPTALYVRQIASSRAGYAEYGTAQNYGMSLVAGRYTLSYFAAAWQGTPYIKCEVFDRNNHSLGSQIIKLTKNIDKNLSVGTYDANYGVVNFTAPSTDYYHFRWTPVLDEWGNGGDWLEVLFGHIKIQHATAQSRAMTFGTTDNIEEFVGAEKVEDDPVYSLSGVKLAPSLNGASLPAGVYIHKGKKIVVK
jgi:hypothetical protein